MRPERETLRIAAVQADLVWHDPKANMKSLSEMIADIDRADLIILPEMFTSGFTMDPAGIAEPDGGPVWDWLAEMSSSADAAICGSVAAVANGDFFNRFLWAQDGKTRAVYDKRHLFRMAGEHEVYSPGKGSAHIELGGFKILPRICYDLRFPVWNRDREAHLQIYVANWPAPRVDAWDKLAAARSIENLCYTAAVNRVGTDGKGIAYPGHSAVYDFKGVPAVSAFHNRPCIITTDISRKELDDFREKFPAHLDADDFTIKY